MTDNDKQASQSFGLTKSFLKKSRPEVPKLKTTYESNELEGNIEDTGKDLKSASNNYSEDFDDENSKKSSPSLKYRKSTEKNESENEEDTIENTSLSPKLSPNKHDSEELKDNTSKPILQGTTPNLLSKVMFIDSLESGMLGAQTLKQINEVKHSSELEQNSKMNTQTRQDLDELHAVYRNLTTHADSGLNTMNKSSSYENQHEEKNDEKNLVQLENLNNSLYNSDIGLQAVNLVKEELEQRILDQVVEVINAKPKTDNLDWEPKWPPSKYKHIKSTGYGSTWKSKSIKKNQINQSTVTLRPYRSNHRVENSDSFRNDSFDFNFEKNNQIVKKLQGKLVLDLKNVGKKCFFFRSID